MIEALSLQQLAQRCDAQWHNDDVQFDSVSTDSRSCQAGDLFVALRGERFDGHQFIADVSEAGACAAVVEEKQNHPLPQLVVDNTVHALGKLGALNRENFTGKLVAITGSSGKTTLKEMLASILAVRSSVLSTKGNLNNHIGVPLTLLQLESGHDYAVIEMGASAEGEIAYLAQLASPHVSVVNNVGTAHVEGFGSVEQIASGKGEIYQALDAQGVAVINRDDAYSDLWLSNTTHCRQLTYTVDESQQADIYASDVVLNATAQASFSLHSQQGTTPVSLSLVGRHNVANALAAAACALVLGVDLDAVKQGLEAIAPVDGRMQVLQGLAGSVVINDTYNANPESVCAAIDALASMQGKRVLVLGAMGELGEHSDTLHAHVGEYAKQAKVDALLCIGSLTQQTAEAFGETAQHFISRQELTQACQALAGPETIFLLKGSRFTAMEQVVGQLVDHAPSAQSTESQGEGTC